MNEMTLEPPGMCACGKFKVHAGCMGPFPGTDITKCQCMPCPVHETIDEQGFKHERFKQAMYARELQVVQEQHKSAGGAGATQAWPSESCRMCGRRYLNVWRADDATWAVVTGRKDGGGLRCMTCFEAEATLRYITLYWECTSDRFPTEPPVHALAPATEPEKEQG